MKEIHKQNLKDIYKVFNEMGIPLFLISGTLLGFVRNNDFIDGDLDVDLGMFACYWKPEIVDKILEKEFKFKHSIGIPECGLLMTFIKNGYAIDIHLYYPEHENNMDDRWYHYAYVGKKWGWECPEMIRFRFPYFGLTETEFKGIKVLVPTIPEIYLKLHYDEDWNIPKKARKEWLYYVDPPNLEKMYMRMPLCKTTKYLKG